jgi:hypothetical protein
VERKLVKESVKFYFFNDMVLMVKYKNVVQGKSNVAQVERIKKFPAKCSWFGMLGGREGREGKEGRREGRKEGRREGGKGGKEGRREGGKEGSREGEKEGNG